MSKRRRSVNSLSSLVAKAAVVPPLVEEVCRYLEENALDTLHLFREAGGLSETLALKKKYNAGKTKISLSNYSHHSLATLLSQYLLDLEPPLMTYDLYDAWIACMGVEPKEMQVLCIKLVLHSLPPANVCILQRVIRLLVHVSRHSKTNRMTTADLAVTLGSCLLHPKAESASSQFIHASSAHALIAAMITDYDEIFIGAFDKRPRIPREVPSAFLDIYDAGRAKMLETLGDKTTSKARKELLGKMKALTIRSAEPAVPETAEDRAATKVQALWRGYSLRQKLRGMHLEELAEYFRHLDGFVAREREFLWHLSKAVREFEAKLKQTRYAKLANLTSSPKTPARKRESEMLADLASDRDVEQEARNAEAEIAAMLVNINAVQEVHSMQLDNITAHMKEHWPSATGTGAALLANLDLFIVYGAYIDMYKRVQRATSPLLRLAERNSSLADMLTTEAGSYRFRRTLKELLDMPLAHCAAGWPAIGPLLRLTLEREAESADSLAMVRAFHAMRGMRRFFAFMQNWVAGERLIETEAVLVNCPFKLSAKGRRLVREGAAQIAGESRYLMLFNDCLVVGKRSAARQLGTVFRYQYHIDLEGCVVEDAAAEKDAWVVRTKERTYLVAVRAVEDKQPWLDDMQATVTEWNHMVFGLPLAIVVDRHGCTDDGVPAMVHAMTTHLQVNDLTSAAVMCCAEDEEETAALVATVEKAKTIAKLRYAKYAPQAVVHALQRFFLDLPSPLLSSELCSEFPLFEDSSCRMPDLDAFQELVQTMPELRRHTLYHMARFLAACETSKDMVAAAWAPCLVRARKASLDACLPSPRPAAILLAMMMQHKAMFTMKRDIKISRRRKKSAPSVISLGGGNGPSGRHKKRSVAKRLMRSASSTLLSNRL